MFALGNATFACGVRSAHERSFEEASGETEVGRGLLAPEPRPLLPLAPRTHPRHTNRTRTWSSDVRRHYFAWNWTTPVVMLATVVATTATLSSNSYKSASFFYAFYFRSLESVCWERHVSHGNEQLQVSARIKKLTALSLKCFIMSPNTAGWVT